MSLAIQVDHRYDAPPERVFDAWLDPASACRFLFRTAEGELVRCEIDARAAGGFTIVERRAGGEASHYGKYLEIEPPHRLVFEFSVDPAAKGTPVTIDIVPMDGGAQLTLTHEMAPEWADHADRTREGWAMLLANLERVLG
jgi:uncharacterized protein YndB with AHSA1/START domain